MSNDNDDNLPQTLGIKSPVMTQPKNTEEVFKQDIYLSQFGLEAVAHSWGHVETIDQVCKLALTQSKLLADRRHLLGLPYGAKDAERDEIPAIPIY